MAVQIPVHSLQESLKTKFSYSRIIAVAECSDIWRNADLLFQDGFGFGIEFANNPIDLRQRVENGPSVDIFIAPSNDGFLRPYENSLQDVQAYLTNTWCVVDALDNPPHWQLPRYFGLVRAIFTQHNESALVIGMFSSVVFEKWGFNQARQKPPQTVNPPIEVAVVAHRPSRRSRAERMAMLGSSHKFARALVSSRRDFFGPCGADPYFSILLELYFSESHKHPIDITGLSAQLRLPMSTLTRKIGYLHHRKMIDKVANEDDRRRCGLVLTARARDVVSKYLESLVCTVA